MLKTERLLLRKWHESDAESLFEYAKNPKICPIAGWPPHKSVEDSLHVIRNVLNGAESYAICEKENGKAIGAIELILNGYTEMTDRDDECELGYWLGQPFWGRGYAMYRRRSERFCVTGLRILECVPYGVAIMMAIKSRNDCRKRLDLFIIILVKMFLCHCSMKREWDIQIE